MTKEGPTFPTSSLIAGWGKTVQIQRYPFRTYYSELDRLIYEADCLLCLGFGFGDSHINFALGRYRDNRNRRVVLVDWADDSTLTAGSNFMKGSSAAQRARGIFNTPPHLLRWLGYGHPGAVKHLKDAREFERSIEPSRHLSIWYGGMWEASQYADKFIRELIS
jgi:hypothetical protein